MFSVVRAGFVAVMLSLLAGCAGKDFVRPSSDTFKLGQATYTQVVQQMGEPRNTGNVLMNEKNVKTATYVYASTGGEPVEEDVIPARALSYYFYNDVLVGQEFISSFKSDNSNFDDSRISAIFKGKTTRAEVIQLLGTPTATFVYPMTKQTSGEAIGYTYHTTRGGVFSGLKFFTKLLRIAFDDKDIVSEIDYTTTGNK
jgi:outer membrane protein assembly factor BamE (lipoprotein component of BamABCDE complex)